MYYMVFRRYFKKQCWYFELLLIKFLNQCGGGVIVFLKEKYVSFHAILGCTLWRQPPSAVIGCCSDTDVHITARDLKSTAQLASQQ